jgi:hypothetical protein
MMHAKNPAAGGAAGLDKTSLPGGIDCPSNAPKTAPAQADNGASELSCASMRADELRGGLHREISRVMAIGLQAQAALYDADDEVALACLRLHWRVTFSGISPLAGELAALRRARAAT